MKNKKIICVIFLLVILFACDHGIAPEPTRTGISGNIYYKNWPPLEQIVILKLIVFKDFPPENIIDEVIGGRAIIYPEDLATSLPLDVDSTFFLIEVETGTYEYVVVAQQYGPNLYNDWRAVGQYDTTPQDSLPTNLTVIQDKMLNDINVNVDFDSLPIQPF